MGLCYSVDRTTGKEPGETSTTATTAETGDERLGSGRWRRPRDLKGGGDIEGIPQVLGRLVSNGSSKVACLYTQQGKKGTNQDAMLVSETVENDKAKNASREALTTLRWRAQTTKTSLVPSPFDSMMIDIEAKSLVQLVCSTCGSHDSSEPTWMMLPGVDLFAAFPFHVVHTILEKDTCLVSDCVLLCADEDEMEFESKNLQFFVKEKAC